MHGTENATGPTVRPSTRVSMSTSMAQPGSTPVVSTSQTSNDTHADSQIPVLPNYVAYLDGLSNHFYHEMGGLSTHVWISRNEPLEHLRTATMDDDQTALGSRGPC